MVSLTEDERREWWGDLFRQGVRLEQAKSLRWMRCAWCGVLDVRVTEGAGQGSP